MIEDSLDIKATLDASPHESYKCFSEAEEAPDDPMEGNKAADELPDFEGAVDIEEERDVKMLLRVGPEPTTLINPQFRSKRYRQWVDLLAFNFIRSNQHRPDDPSQVYRLDG